MSTNEYDDEFPLPPTTLGDWVMLAPISNDAKALYWVLAAHMSAGSDVPKPTSALLAEVLGYSDSGKIRPLLDELASVDAVNVRTIRDGQRNRNAFTIHQTPPENYAGPRDLREFYATRATTPCTEQ
ncbi:hypothetical protein [Nocardia vaccinii]|uniref:hypothetical protein n=1 Tax=Nocardia vaccinii TaxID=1822 RepID=UPI000829F86E|nr:hypothetical protein [Nocardia vaccinii]